MMVLRMDFRRIRQLVKLVVRREQVSLATSKVAADLFKQRLSDLVDTGGGARSSSIDKDFVDKIVKLPAEEWTLGGGSVREGDQKQQKRRKLESSGEDGVDVEESRQPVPLFTDFMPTRERVVVTPNDCGNPVDSDPHGEVPTVVSSYITNYIDPSDMTDESRFLFKHRGRIGRGGRICIDRVRMYAGVEGGEQVRNQSVIHARRGNLGGGMRTGALMDFVATGFNNPMVRENINEIAAAWSDDEEEVVVNESDWIGEDREKWGKERFVVGPF